LPLIDLFGRARPAKLVPAILRRPDLAPALWRLERATSLATAHLADAVCKLLQALSLDNPCDLRPGATTAENEPRSCR
jgi:hypothetical protein